MRSRRIGKDGEIIIQGEVKEKVLNILRENKYRAK